MTNIVLDEYLWAEEALNDLSLGDKPSVTLCRIAKYYKENGLTSQEIVKKLESFILRCDSNASIPKWSDSIEHAVKMAFKYGTIRIDKIPITVEELNTIHDKVSSSPQQRLAFTLLVMSKYWDIVRDTNDHWVNTKDKDLMNMACIRTSVKKQSEMFAKLHSLGMIQFASRVDSLNTRVLFQGGDEIAMHITDLRNLGYQYLKYFCGDFYECTNCGLIVKRDSSKSNVGRKPKYCPDCAREIDLINRINSVMRQRGKPTI